MDVRVLDSLVALALFATAFLVIRFFFRRRFGLQHKKILYFVLAMASFTFGAYLAFIWRIFELLVGALAAAGVLGLVLGFALVPWISDIFAGVALLLDPHLKIGADVEIGGKRGRIIDIQLTRTKISGDECLIIVPNRKFRDEVVLLYSTKAPRGQVSF
ncbi:MAG: mechanosensitive ion channel [Nitrososphaerota archaeon]